jgi:hypothetical protein
MLRAALIRPLITSYSGGVWDGFECVGSCENGAVKGLVVCDGAIGFELRFKNISANITEAKREPPPRR